MTATAEKITGGCMCGAVRYRISGAPVLMEYCHCGSCRRAASAPLMAWAAYETGGFEMTAGKPADYRSSPGVVRTFCGTCGSSLTLIDERFDEIYVAMATFDEPESAVPEFHIWRSERLPWLETADDWPRYLRFKYQGEMDEAGSGS